MSPVACGFSQFLKISTMENDDNPDALVDSFFLPGGILDPESYEEEKEKAALDSSYPQAPSQPSPQKQLLPTTTAPFTSFPPAINPNNPWAQTGTPRSPGATPQLGSDQTSSFFQSDTPFQLQASPLGVAAALPTISSPPRIEVSMSRPPPGFQAPPGFENVPRERSFTDDESIQSVPRELLPDKSSYAGSSTSSLSGSSVDEGDDDDDDDDEEEDDNEDQDDVVVEDVTEYDAEERALEDDEAANHDEENDTTVELEESFEEDVELFDEKQEDHSNWKDEQEDCPQTPEREGKAARTIGGKHHEPVNTSSPLLMRDIHEKDTPISSPSQLKPKQRKRRGTRKSKTQQSPIQEKEIATVSKVDPLPVLEKKAVKAKPKEKVVKVSQQHDLWKEIRIIIDTLTRDLAILASFTRVVYRAALDEALGDTVALGSYLFFRYCPMIVGRFIVEVSLPHWTSHLVTIIGVWQICTPARKDETVVPLNLLRVAAVVGFVVDGFSQEHAAIMMIPGTMRMLLVFLLLMIRGGYWDSTLLWFSLMVQILLAFVFSFDQILIMIGLASLNYKRNLALNTAVLKAPRT
jgi:hypothetical protein